VTLIRRKWHAIDRNRPAATGSNELGEALPPNGIGYTTGHNGKQRKPPALNQRFRGSRRCSRTARRMWVTNCVRHGQTTQMTLSHLQRRQRRPSWVSHCHLGILSPSVHAVRGPVRFPIRRQLLTTAVSDGERSLSRQYLALTITSPSSLSSLVAVVRDEEGRVDSGPKWGRSTRNHFFVFPV
jgi:hypothetical protein